MTYRAAIFDLDGLLLDTESLGKWAWGKAFDEFGWTLTEELYAELVGRDMRAREAVLRERFGDLFPFEEMKRRRIAIGDEKETAEPIPVKKGAIDLLRVFADAEVPVALATGTERVRTERRLASTGLRKYFTSVVTMDDVEHGKPAPDIFLRAAANLNVFPSECVVFEDSSVGVLAAIRAGMKVYMVPDFALPTVEARQQAALVVESLHDLLAIVRVDFGFQ